MKIKLNKPFAKSVNDKPVCEIDFDLNNLNVKDYVSCIASALEEGEVDLTVALKLGSKTCRHLIAKAIGCIPDFINDLSLADYRKFENECTKWFIDATNKNTIELDFSKISTSKYIEIKSANAINEIGNFSSGISAKGRMSFISAVSGKSIEDLETMPAFEYIPMDYLCSSFFLVTL